MARTYNQECILAYALDLLGERWTLLIVRELFLGPRRFGDLHAALPGIGTNLLSKRLKELDEADLVRGGDGFYRLTETGEGLRPTLRAMMMWSIDYFMRRPEPSPPRECIFADDLQPDSVALALEMFANQCAGPHDNYVLRMDIDDSPYTYYFMNGETTARRGEDAPAVARIVAEVGPLMRLMRGELAPEAAQQTARISGDAEAAAHFLRAVAPGAEKAREVADLIAGLRRAEAARARAADEAAGAAPAAANPVRESAEA